MTATGDPASPVLGGRVAVGCEEVLAVWRILIAVARRPTLWPEVVRAVPALARRHWWRRFPFLPLPDRAYLRWRIATAYGSPVAPVRDEDLVAYLEWRRLQR